MPPVIFETEILESSTSAHAAKSALHTPLSNQTTGQRHIWMLGRFSSLTTLPNWITTEYWATCKFPTFEFHQLPISVFQIPRCPGPKTHTEFLITSPAYLWEWFWKSKRLDNIHMLARISSLITLPNSITADYWTTCEFPHSKTINCPSSNSNPYAAKTQKHTETRSNDLTRLFVETTPGFGVPKVLLTYFLSDYTSKIHHCKLPSYVSISPHSKTIIQ